MTEVLGDAPLYCDPLDMAVHGFVCGREGDFGVGDPCDFEMDSFSSSSLVCDAPGAEPMVPLPSRCASPEYSYDVTCSDDPSFFLFDAERCAALCALCLRGTV